MGQQTNGRTDNRDTHSHPKTTETYIYNVIPALAQEGYKIANFLKIILSVRQD